MAQALRSSSSIAETDPEQAKFNQRLVDKLKYCKEVLVSIRTASAGGGGNGASGATEEGGMGELGMGMMGSLGISTRTSKASLR